MVDCDNCGAYSDSPSAKSVCIHCFRKLVKIIKKLKKEKGFTNEEMRFIIDVADNGLETPEQDERFELIRERCSLNNPRENKK